MVWEPLLAKHWPESGCEGKASTLDTSLISIFVWGLLSSLREGKNQIERVSLKDTPKFYDSEEPDSLRPQSVNYFSQHLRPLAFSVKWLTATNYEQLSPLKAPILTAIHLDIIVWSGVRAAVSQRT